MNDLLFDKFYNRALRFLSFRPRSQKEIEDFLKKKSSFAKVFDPEDSDRRASEGQERSDLQSVINAVIKKLKEQKFLNDEEFAKWWIEQRTQFKPRSLYLIKIELKQKGIGEETIELGIKNQELGIAKDSELAKKLVEKKIQRYKNLPKHEIYQKMGRFLAQKGFNYETIKQSIDEILSGDV
ncbi:MAG: RecX family transcriptional regulator [bacterium]|nr:RecX family transcriptional regulator [bacterium]